jgi:hypothetical protein
MRPLTVRGLYLSQEALADARRRQSLFDFIGRSAVNSLVVGVKDASGRLSLPVAHPLAREIGAFDARLGPDLASEVRNWRQQGLHMVALIVLFKDDLDPASGEVQDYNLAVAQAAAAAGFDEIHFDFVRFPADPPSREGAGAREQQRRLEVVTGFLERASDLLAGSGVSISVSVFGSLCTEPRAGIIGQDMRIFARHADYLSPMLYPAYFPEGDFDIPMRRSYRLVYENLRAATSFLDGNPRRLRPWLQAFHDPEFPGQGIDARQVRAQVDAAQDAGSSGWMLWESGSRYELAEKALRSLPDARGKAVSSAATGSPKAEVSPGSPKLRAAAR